MPTQVVIVSSEASASYTQVNTALIDALARAGVPKTVIVLLSPSELAQRAKEGRLGLTRIFVAVGARATQALLAIDPSAPVLSTLIPRQSFAQLLQSSGRKTSARLSVLYLDQPLRRQISLIQLALPQARKVGILLGPNSVGKLPELIALAQDRGMTLRQTQVTGEQPLFEALRVALDGSDVLLALADPTVFNSTSIQNILLSSFRLRVPMVAFSPAYTRAGAVLSLYSSPEQMGVQTAHLVLAAWRSGSLPELPVEPDDFLVDVNTNVARALGLALDGAALRLALRRQEYRP
ncbi:MAG: hypothetical protein AUJ20_06505 [Comamonadaceae bacterium CG1_02_60_18]|nr:MAG: hypothetical protein AUJ20_06505 [Comamonadaceae bacterium CG1_02_60_18]